jgi:hypothetical protein
MPSSVFPGFSALVLKIICIGTLSPRDGSCSPKTVHIRVVLERRKSRLDSGIGYLTS